MASSTLPANVHVSTHPCLRAKISQLRSNAANAREIKSLVHEIALIVGCETLAKSLDITSSGTVSSTCTATPTSSSRVQPYDRFRNSNVCDNQAETPLGYTYSLETTTPNVVLVPILRSGLGMLDGRLSPISRGSWTHHVPQRFRLCSRNLFRSIIWASSANLPAFSPSNITTTSPTIVPPL